MQVLETEELPRLGRDEGLEGTSSRLVACGTVIMRLDVLVDRWRGAVWGFRQPRSSSRVVYTLSAG